MTDDEKTLSGDGLDAAIASVDDKEQAQKLQELQSLIADFTFEVDGSKMKLIVPIDFTSDKFETAVNLLTQLRFKSEQVKAARQKIITPDKPKLQSIDGRRLI